MTSRLRLIAGATALLICGQYLVAEGIAASAFTPSYSYRHNFISDLGVAACGSSGPCSPLAGVMNAGFVLSGGLAILAASLLAPLLITALRRLVIGLAIMHGVGSAIVGLVHSAPGTSAGTPHLHVLGAYAAIMGGNLALIMAGLAASPAWSRPWFRAASAFAGTFGLASGLGLVLADGLPQGLLERGAVDTITVWEVCTGGLLAARLRRSAATKRI